MVEQTPIVRDSSFNKEEYRGLATAQMRILKDYMKVGGLTAYSRVVTLANGVVITCQKSFNREDIFIRVPQVVSEYTTAITETVCKLLKGFPTFSRTVTFGSFPDDVYVTNEYLTGDTYLDGVYSIPIARITDEPVTIDGEKRTWIDWIILYAPSSQIVMSGNLPVIGETAVSYVTKMRGLIGAGYLYCSPDNVIHTELYAVGSLRIYQISKNASLKNDMYTFVKSASKDVNGYNYWCVYNLHTYSVLVDFTPGVIFPDIIPLPPPVIPPEPPPPVITNERILKLLRTSGTVDVHYIDPYTGIATIVALAKCTVYVYITYNNHNIYFSPYANDVDSEGLTTALYFLIGDLSAEYLRLNYHIYYPGDYLAVPSVTVGVSAQRTFASTEVSVPVGITTVNF